MNKFIFVLIILILLSACGPKITGIQTRERTLTREVEVIPPKEVFEEPVINHTVDQIFKKDKIEWSFDSDKNLVQIQHGPEIVKFYYKDGLLRKISDGEKSVELEYYNGYLSSA
ncbi:hypothetical protein GF358_03705, partial [Candidatus Woesearchaeota archaeon]|nr:hypothetical protein [Candidatus Woesearchaeota archaeon]